MPRRDLIRNVIIVAVLVLALILLRIFVFHPFSINDKMANASVKTGDLVVMRVTSSSSMGRPIRKLQK